MSAERHKVNEEVRIRFTGTARFDRDQAEWAIREATAFATQWSVLPGRHTGLRRGVVYSGGVLGDLSAYIYFTPSRAVVVRIHGSVGER